MRLWDSFGLERDPFEVKPVELYGLIPLETFIGREKEKDKAIKNITASNRSISLIIGERGIGKISLSNKVKSELYQDYFVPIKEIDCQSEWTSKEFILNLLGELYYLNERADQYKDLPENYEKTAEAIEEVLGEAFGQKSSEKGGSLGVSNIKFEARKTETKSLRDAPLNTLKAKYQSVVDIVRDNGYEGMVLHYNNLDNINEDVEGFSGTLADLRDFLVSDYSHFIFCGDKRMEEAFREDRKVSECVSVNIHLEPMNNQEIWNVIQKRCSLFEMKNKKHTVPVNADAVGFVTKLHNGNIRKVFSALKTAIINKGYESTPHQINESELKHILLQEAENKVKDDVSPKAMEILEYFIETDEELNNRKISREFDIDKSTTSNYLAELKESNLILKSREEGKKR